MKAFLYTATALALAVPASAQLLGGGLGGSVGGLGGSLGGSVQSTISRSRIDTNTVTRAERRAARGSASTSLAADRSMLRTRGAVAASRRGMVSVAPTARGVAVFVPKTTVAAPTVVVPAPARTYPVYNSTYYYGAAAPVVIRETEVRTYMDQQQRDFERGLEGTGATVRRQGDDLIVQLPADVTFAFNQADIRPRFYPALDAFARTLREFPGTDVEVIGHTDAIGSEAYNQRLSELRGRAVADYLVAARTEPSRLIVEAMGEAEPVASNATIEGRAANRRVELIVHPRAG
jgi:outer membrane protein OmpA-like peptidoglycan-associated protein